MAGQLFVLSLHAGEYYRRADREKLIRHYFSLSTPGGIFLNGGTIDEVYSLVHWLQFQSAVPLWIAADIERGVGGAFKGGTPFPHAAMWGATDDPALILRAARQVAKEARALGINGIFAPVVDLLSPNPVVSIRAFHENPEKVALFASAFLEGLAEECILGVVKHFPGHSLVEEDSHRLRPVIRDDKMVEWHEKPFVMVKQQFRFLGIMTAHLWKNDGSWWLDREKIEQITAVSDFPPLWISDDLSMAGAGEEISPEKLVDLIRMGHHLLLNPPSYQLAVRWLEEFMEADGTFRQIVQNRVQHILTYKRKFRLGSTIPRHYGRMNKFIGTAETRALAARIAEDGMVCLKKAAFHPVDPSENILHLIHTAKEDEFSTLESFRDRWKNYTEGYSEQFTPKPEKRRKNIRRIVSFYQRVYGGVRVTVPEKEWSDLCRHILAENDVIILWGNPFPVLPVVMESPATVLWIPSYMPMAQVKAFEALIGKIPVTGKNPAPSAVRLHKSIPSQMMIEHVPSFTFTTITDKEILNFVEEWHRKGAFTALAAAHIERSRVYTLCWGRAKNQRNQIIQPDENTLFDLASLTKILATTPLLLHAIDKKLIRWDTPLRHFFPVLPDEKKRITIRQLMTHSAGFPSWKPYFQACTGGEEITGQILREPLIYPPDEKIVYSDLGYILLGIILERIFGKTLRELFRDVIADPLGIGQGIFYLSERKLKRFSFVSSNADWHTRNSWSRFINDENARLFPEGAGHAGLFGHLNGLIRWTDWIFREGRWYDQKIISAEILHSSWQRFRAASGEERAIGWDIPTGDTQAGYLYQGKQAIGHLGYTGCSLWLFPSVKRATILLTNRSFTGFPVDRFRQFRREFHNLLGKVLLRKNQR